MPPERELEAPLPAAFVFLWLGAAALTFAAYAARRGLRVNARRGGNAAAAACLVGSVAGFFGGFRNGSPGLGGILLVAGMSAAVAARVGAGRREPRAAIYVAAAAILAAFLVGAARLAGSL